MNWDQVMHIDLGALLRGGTPPDDSGWRGPGYTAPLRPGRLRWRSDLINITRQLEGFVAANVDLAGGIEAVIGGVPKRRLRRLYRVLLNDLATGASLTEAVRRRPAFFPRYYCDMVRAGEESGKLEQALAGLADHLEHRKKIGATAAGWLIYLVVLFVVQAVIVSFILVKVQPVFAEILGDFERGLPPVTVFLNSVGDFVYNRWWMLCAGVGLVALGVVVVRSLLRARGFFDEIAGRVVSFLPVLRVLVVKRDLAHASLALEMLLGAGVPLDKALEAAATLDVNPLYARAFKRLARRAAEGGTLHEAMKRESPGLLPASFRGIVSLGEGTGLVPEAFGRIGRLYEREAAKVQRVLAEGLMPLFLAVPATVVLLISLSWFVAYTSIFDVFFESM